MEALCPEPRQYLQHPHHGRSCLVVSLGHVPSLLSPGYFDGFLNNVLKFAISTRILSLAYWISGIQIDRRALVDHTWLFDSPQLFIQGVASM